MCYLGFEPSSFRTSCPQGILFRRPSKCMTQCSLTRYFPVLKFIKIYFFLVITSPSFLNLILTCSTKEGKQRIFLTKKSKFFFSHLFYEAGTLTRDVGGFEPQHPQKLMRQCERPRCFWIADLLGQRPLRCASKNLVRVASKGLPAAVQRPKVREKDTDIQTETYTLIDTVRSETKHGTRTSIFRRSTAFAQKKILYCPSIHFVNLSRQVMTL